MYIPEIDLVEQQLNDKIYRFREKKMNFVTTETTGTSQIDYYNKKCIKQTIFFKHDLYSSPEQMLDPDYNSNIVPIICRRVIADVKKYLEKNPMPKYDNGTHFCTRDLNIKLLNTIEPRQIIKEIDINKFYWTHAYHKGFISYKTFKQFMRYKGARLIALGNLAKTKVIKHYEDGRLVLTENITSQYAPFFYNIVCEGFDIYCKVQKAINSQCFYFQTDAYWVQPGLHTERKIKEVLDTYNLDYKIKKYKVKEIDKNHITLTNLVSKEDKIVALIYN